jgi:uncharacterized membrane protein YphA (DoxX/SURF4 family)
MSEAPHPSARELPAVANVLLRVALSSAYLSAVADRFGLWGPPGSPNVAWGSFASFTEFTGLLLGFAPASLVPALAWAATVAEVIIALGLLSGLQLRRFAFASAGLLTSFALSMTISLGPESAFTYSVWTAAAASLVLASRPQALPNPAPRA